MRVGFPESTFTVPWTNVNPEGAELLLLKMEFGKALSPKPIPNSITAIRSTAMTSL